MKLPKKHDLELISIFIHLISISVTLLEVSIVCWIHMT
jgi:hypothetical protein